MNKIKNILYIALLATIMASCSNTNEEYYCVLKGTTAINNLCTGLKPYNNPTSKTYTLQELKRLDMPDNNMEKEIIGYKAPYDLFEGKVKKGQIAIAFSKPFSGEKAYHFKIEGLENTVSDTLPKEIVEQWEPVHKEEFKVEVDDWVTCKEGFLTGDSSTAHVENKAGHGYRAYSTFKVGSLKDTRNSGKVVFPENSGFGVYLFALRKATPEEIEKASKTIVKMHSSNKGEFEIEVVNKKAYYRPENKELTREFIEEILDWFDDSKMLSANTQSKLIYLLKVDSVKVGCMEGTRKADWEKVYNLIK